MSFLEGRVGFVHFWKKKIIPTDTPHKNLQDIFLRTFQELEYKEAKKIYCFPILEKPDCFGSLYTLYWSRMHLIRKNGTLPKKCILFKQQAWEVSSAEG